MQTPLIYKETLIPFKACITLGFWQVRNSGRYSPYLISSETGLILTQFHKKGCPLVQTRVCYKMPF